MGRTLLAILALSVLAGCVTPIAGLGHDSMADAASEEQKRAILSALDERLGR
jgi:hypothetical protein